MKPMEIIEKLYESNPEIFGGVAKKKAVTILRVVLKEINRKLENIEEGKLAIPPLGVFVVRTVQKDYQKVKRIVFRPGKVK